MLRCLDRAEGREQSRIILHGGTAARLGHGRTRASADIDADATETLDVWELLSEAYRNLLARKHAMTAPKITTGTSNREETTA